jgi:arginine/ornithine N-succinyltransferase beta subunit
MWFREWREERERRRIGRAVARAEGFWSKKVERLMADRTALRAEIERLKIVRAADRAKLTEKDRQLAGKDVIIAAKDTQIAQLQAAADAEQVEVNKDTDALREAIDNPEGGFTPSGNA